MALPLPRHAASAGADLATPHTGLRIPVLLIEGVRAHASTISMGALAVFRACRPAPAASLGAGAVASAALQEAPDHSPAMIAGDVQILSIGRAAGFLPALGSVV